MGAAGTTGLPAKPGPTGRSGVVIPVIRRVLRPHRLFVGFAVVLFAASLLGGISTDMEVPAAGISGAFERGNADVDVVPPTAAPLPGRFWSSWAARDGSTGTVSLGPFPAPARIELEMAGYPGAAGNRILLVNTATGATLPRTVADPGEDFKTVQLVLPDSWRGDPVMVEFVDGSAEPAGWIAVSEPRAIPWWAAWWGGILPRAAAVLMVGCATLFLLSAAALLFRGLPAVQGPGRMMAAAAVVMATAYAVLWAHFFNHEVGAFLVPVIFAGAAVVWILRRADARMLWRDPDWRLPAFTALAVAAFFTGVLFSFTVSRPAYLTAGQRYADYGFPPDNILPTVFAERLAQGTSLRPFFDHWLSSDRPPLQSGWILLAAPAAAVMGEDSDDASQFAGIWFQLLWVPAVWALVRRMGLGARASVLVVGALALSGFFLLNSTYVWPKLGAAALLLAAFLNWFLPPPEAESGTGRFVLGGAQAALAFLSHGGVVFALIPAGFFALWRLRSHLRHWLAAAAVMLLLIAPWIAYQKLSDPPGDRLLKMHLGGIAEVDHRPVLQAIEESYAAFPARVHLQVRWFNLRQQFWGPWSELATFRVESPNATRDQDFRHTFFALGWWNLGFGVLAASALPAVRKRLGAATLRDLTLLLAWSVLTLVVWIALIFTPEGTVIHQGSYTVQLVLLASLAVILWKFHPLAFACVAIAHGAVFPRIWLSPPLSFAGRPLRQDSVVLSVLAIASVLLIVLFSESRRKDDPGPAVPEPAVAEPAVV